VADLHRGINLGSALDAPKEGDWGNVLTEQHFRLAKQGGMDHIRLPVRWSAHALTEPPYTIDETFFERIDWALDQATANGLALILDMHHYVELMADPAGHESRFLALWRQISERYRTRGSWLKYELLNEPTQLLTTRLWNALLAKAVAQIRVTEPTRALIVAGATWSSAASLADLDLPNEDNLVVTFHSYEPILFAIQGAPWMEPEYQTTGVVFPGPPAKPLVPVAAAANTPWVKAWFDGYNTLPTESNPCGPRAIADVMAQIDRYIEQTNRQVYLGEFAVVDKADDGSRERWVRASRRAAEERGLPWAYWDDGGMNRAMNASTATWIPYLQAALTD
jgi:endoglucanase